MLILTRQTGQALKIGDDTEIQVLGVKGNQVRLGINAPEDVPVHREQIYRKIQKQTSAIDSEAQTLDGQSYSGCITNILKSRGYGFIYVPGLPYNVFFHANNVSDRAFDELDEGVEVNCLITEKERGLVAVKVERTNTIN